MILSNARKRFINKRMLLFPTLTGKSHATLLFGIGMKKKESVIYRNKRGICGQYESRFLQPLESSKQDHLMKGVIR